MAFERLQLTPRMMGIMVGQDLIVENRDHDTHNAHVLPWHNKETNDVMHQKGESIRRRFTEPERGLPLKCDIQHGSDGKRGFWARAWITVLPHPFYAVTDDQGRFEIPGLPPGKYTIEAWQENCVPSLQEIEVKEGQAAAIDLVLEARPPNVNRVWDLAPEDPAFKALQGTPIEVDGEIEFTEDRKVVILRCVKKTARCLLAPGVADILKDFPARTEVTFRGTFKGKIDSAHFVLEDCRVSVARGQRFWK